LNFDFEEVVNHLFLAGFFLPTMTLRYDVEQSPRLSIVKRAALFLCRIHRGSPAVYL
jgi:hypothetical protein